MVLIRHAATIAFLVIFVSIHQMAGLSSPPPWPDEAVFLYPSLAFAEHHSFFAPELCWRTLYWMPPGYFVFMGLIFKVVPFSLKMARMTSCVLMCLSALVLLFISKKLLANSLNAILIFFCFLDVHIIECANIARMDALLISLVLSIFVLILNGFRHLALICALMMPLIHPNALFYIPSFIVLAFMKGVDSRDRFRLTASSATLCLTLWISYLVTLFNHFEYALNDYSFQIARKFGRNILENFYDKRLIVVAVVLFVGSFFPEKRVTYLKMTLIGMPGLFVKRIGGESWYTPFEIVFWVFFALIAFSISRDVMRTDRMKHFASRAIETVLIAGILVCYVQFHVVNPHATLKMVTRDRTYLSEDQIVTVRNTLEELSTHYPVPLRVRFIPPGDGLLFRSDAIRSVFPAYNCQLDWDISMDARNPAISRDPAAVESIPRQ